MKKISVTQNNENPIATEILAESIVEISKAMKQIKSSRLNERALLVLLKDATALNFNEIKRVLDSLETLEDMFLKKKRTRNEN
jgi:hypothetical protein